ncbi:AIR synthase [candidate division KSB1 bacterium]|nr:AIR synthase [candidate division KSB1 bacterium]
MKKELPKFGKVSADIFDRVILPQLGKKRQSVLVGPQHGIDVGVVELAGDQVMVLTTDPLFVMPSLGWERAAWFAIHIIASDAATSALPPQYLSIDLNLPLSLQSDDLKALWQEIHKSCKEIGLAVVTGHTGRYEGCAFPTIGAATIISTGHRSAYITPAMADAGDQIIITKGAAIETAGMLAVCCEKNIAKTFGKKFAEKAKSIFWQMSVVKDAAIAAETGVRDNGVTAMHDATECGVWGALVEIAEAAKCGILVHKDDIPLPEKIGKICRRFGINPYISSSEGTLVIACRPHKTSEALRRLSDAGIPAAVVGELLDAKAGNYYFEHQVKYPLEHPVNDPFWPALQRAMREEDKY